MAGPADRSEPIGRHPLVILQQFEDNSQLKHPPGEFGSVFFAVYAPRKHLNPSLSQVILRDHGFARVELPDDDWNIFWCAGQVMSALRRSYVLVCDFYRLRNKPLASAHPPSGSRVVG